MLKGDKTKERANGGNKRGMNWVWDQKYSFVGRMWSTRFSEGDHNGSESTDCINWNSSKTWTIYRLYFN